MAMLNSNPWTAENLSSHVNVFEEIYIKIDRASNSELDQRDPEQYKCVRSRTAPEANYWPSAITEWEESHSLVCNENVTRE